jgi:probable F420-dependent oxidoreductase
MHLGVFMFATDYSMRIDELARAAEERGFESLFAPEHSHIPTSRKTPYPGGGELPEQYWHGHDPFVALMAAAAATRRIRVGTGVCLVIQRDTITLAKEVASLDSLSGGRFLFGIGAGWNREEMENHGTEYKTRFSKLREQVLAMKEIWTRDEPQFHGRHVSFDPLWSWPKPAQKPHPPVLLGGGTAGARERVVDYCDGWLPVGDTKTVLDGIADLRRLAEEKGRQPSTVSVTVFGAQADHATIDAYRSADVERVLLRLPPSDRDQILPLLDRYAELVEHSPA